MQPINSNLIEMIRTKGALNISVMDSSLKMFGRLKLLLQQFEKSLHQEVIKEGIKILYTDRGTYEAELKVADDVLIFILHTNAFVFDSSNMIYKSGYVKADASRATCGMISIYNFLSDSITFERNHDEGQLIGRIFINQEKHFFVEGKKQIGVLFNDFENAVATDENIQKAIELLLQYCIEMDFYVPPIEVMKEITVNDVRAYTIQNAVDKDNRLGFKFQNENSILKS